MTARSRNILKVIGVLAVLLVGLECIGIRFPRRRCFPRDRLGVVIARVAPQVHLQWDRVLSAAVYVVLLVIGGHLFLRWLYREARRPTEAAGAGPNRLESWR